MFSINIVALAPDECNALTLLVLCNTLTVLAKNSVLEFKQSSDRNEKFLRVKEDEANEQHKSIIAALQAAALEWTF